MDSPLPRPAPQSAAERAVRAAIESSFEQFDLIARNGAVGVIAVRERRIDERERVRFGRRPVLRFAIGHSTLMSASLTIRAYLGISAWMNAANSAGV